MLDHQPVRTNLTQVVRQSSQSETGKVGFAQACARIRTEGSQPLSGNTVEYYLLRRLAEKLNRVSNQMPVNDILRK